MENSCCPLLPTCSACFVGVDAWFWYPGVPQRCSLSLSLPISSATGQCGCPNSLLPFLVQQGQMDQIAGLVTSAVHKVDTGYGGFFLWYILILKGHCLILKGKTFFSVYSSVARAGLLTFSWEPVWFLQESGWGDPCLSLCRGGRGGSPNICC